MSERAQIADVPLTPGRVLVVERTSPVTIDPASHERLRAVLGESFGAGGTLTSFERVLGWVQGDRGVEVHVQVAPRAGGGSAIRLVQHGVLVSPRLLAVVGGGMTAMTLSALLAAVALGGDALGYGLMALVLALPAVVIGVIAVVGRFGTRRRTKKLEAAAAALVAALAATALPRVRARVEHDAAAADPDADDAERGGDREARGRADA